MCTIPDCGRKAHARGLCAVHYERLRRHGSTDDPTRRPTLEDDVARFNTFVPERPAEGCWSWAGSKNGAYGQFRYQGRPRLAHRVAYIFAYGPIPHDQEIDHLCHNKACVRPDHLHLVTRSQHIKLTYSRDGQRNQWSKKTHCPAGHPYDEQNTDLTPKGYRKCRSCRRAEWQRWKARKRVHPTEPPRGL